jgi:outer membrane receptor for ferrienterochelin and colicins
MRFQNESAGYAVYGSDGLRPEASRNASLGAEWATETGYVRGQLFHNEFDGFIEATLISAPGQPMVFEYRNVDHGYTRGAELEGAAVVGRLRLDAGYALLDTRDRTTGLELLGRPRHSARATLAHPLPFRARASASAIYTGRTPMQRDGTVTSWRDAYPRLDARLARPVARGTELALNVENVLDRRPSLWNGFTGRQYTLAVTWGRGF